MPFIRMPADTTLADTLGQLGQSLGNALDPARRLQALQLQQRMFLEQQQLQQLQRQQSAQQEAIRVYSRLVPPDKLPIIANMIMQNAPQDQIMRQAAMLSGALIDKTDPDSIAKNIRFIEESTGQKWTDSYPPYAGEVTGAYIRDLQAKQAGAVSGAQKTSEIAATRTANEPLIAGYIDQDTPEARASNLKTYMRLHNGDLPADGLPPPIGPVTTEAHNRMLAQRTQDAAQATETGKTLVTGVPADKPFYVPTTLTGGAQPPAAAGGAQPPPTAQPPVTQTPIPKGATPDPNRPGAYWQGGTYHLGVTTGGPPGTVMGAPVGAADTEKTSSDSAIKALNDAYAEGNDANRLMAITNQIRGLSKIARTQGFWGQTTAAIQQTLQQYGLNGITDPQKAQAAMDQLIKTELPGLLKNYGIMRFAKPEIDMMGTVIGNARLPPEVLDNILANVDTTAQYLLDRKGLASRVLGADPQQPMNYPDFQQAESALQNSYGPQLEARRTTYRAIGAANQPVPTVDNQPIGPGGAPATPSFLDSILQGLQWLNPKPSVELQPNPDGTFPPTGP